MMNCLTMHEFQFGIWMRRHALKQRESIANSVAGSHGVLRRRQERVDTYNLLQQRGYCAKRVPQNRGHFTTRFSTFAQFGQCIFPLLRNQQLLN